MSKLQFSTYDFFGYLISGTLFLVYIDSLVGHNWLKGGDLTVAQSAFWTMVAYVFGHMLSSPAKVFIERLLARKMLGHPTAIILGIYENGVKKLLFPGYFQRLPDFTCDKIKTALPSHLINGPPEAIFFESYSISRTKPVILERMNSFMNLYGFSRNISFSSLVVLLLSIISNIFGQKDINCYLQIVLGIIFITFFYRFLKFYHLYSRECLMGLITMPARGEE